MSDEQAPGGPAVGGAPPPPPAPTPGEDRAGDEGVEAVDAESLDRREPAEVEGGDSAEVPAAGSGRRRPGLVLAVIVLAVLSVVLALVAAVLASRLDAERGTRRTVERVAGTFTTALLTYDYNDLDAAKHRVLSLSTGKFKKEYEQAFGGGLDELLKQTQSRSKGTVTDIYVGEVSDGTADVIVVANAQAEGTSGTRRTVASYIQLQLVQVGGRWRVDGVTNLNFGQQSGSPAPSTTTTAPEGK